MVHCDPDRFSFGHLLFERHMARKSGGIPFTGFSHSFLIEDEIQYKWAIVDRARQILKLHEWKRLLRSPGQIIERVKQVTNGSVSRNLLEHRYGKRNSDRALYAATGDQIGGLETQLFHLLQAGQEPAPQFGRHFDELANYLRDERLGSNWPFMAYLAFLANPAHYFPILPSRFQRLLTFYGNDLSLAGRVEWTRYESLLELADLLRERLAVYGRVDAIQIQSYMFVVGHLIEHEHREVDIPPAIGTEAELARRVAAATEKERIGLLGEVYVLEHERRRLLGAGQPELAHATRPVSFEKDSRGYDILSFAADGGELHIEVKATISTKGSDGGFWLSDNERRRAAEDQAWRLFRVWAVDANPHLENLGNIIASPPEDWELAPSTWAFRPKQS